MPRPKRADEANGIYHALNRGNARSTIFKKNADYLAFERILAAGLARYPCCILSYLEEKKVKSIAQTGHKIDVVARAEYADILAGHARRADFESPPPHQGSERVA